MNTCVSASDLTHTHTRTGETDKDSKKEKKIKEGS